MEIFRKLMFIISVVVCLVIIVYLASGNYAAAARHFFRNLVHRLF